MTTPSNSDLKKAEEEIDTNVVYAPNSIYHGCEIYGVLSMSKEMLLTIEVGRLTDFIEWLFEHSEHCDHITQREAWDEFEVYEIEEAKKWRG